MNRGLSLAIRIGSDAIGGIVTGAAIGSLIGPRFAAIGAVLGMACGVKLALWGNVRRLWRSVIGWFALARQLRLCRMERDEALRLLDEEKRKQKAAHSMYQARCSDNEFQAKELAAMKARAQLAEETNADNIAQARTSLGEKDRRIAYLEADAAQYARDRETIERLTTELDAAKHNNQVLLAADRNLAGELRSVKRERDELRQGMRNIHAVIKAHELSLIEIGEPETATVHITRKQWEPNPILPDVTVADTTGENE